jgi:hypothetical protein
MRILQLNTMILHDEWKKFVFFFLRSVVKGQDHSFFKEVTGVFCAVGGSLVFSYFYQGEKLLRSLQCKETRFYSSSIPVWSTLLLFWAFKFIYITLFIFLSLQIEYLNIYVSYDAYTGICIWYKEFSPDDLGLWPSF